MQFGATTPSEVELVKTALQLGPREDQVVGGRINKESLGEWWSLLEHINSLEAMVEINDLDRAKGLVAAIDLYVKISAADTDDVFRLTEMCAKSNIRGWQARYDDLNFIYQVLKERYWALDMNGTSSNSAQKNSTSGNASKTEVIYVETTCLGSVKRPPSYKQSKKRKVAMKMSKLLAWEV